MTIGYVPWGPYPKALDCFSFVYSIVNARPEKRVSTSDEDLITIISNASSKLNELFLDLEGWIGFLEKFGKDYQLAANEEFVYSVAVRVGLELYFWETIYGALSDGLG